MEIAVQGEPCHEWRNQCWWVVTIPHEGQQIGVTESKMTTVREHVTCMDKHNYMDVYRKVRIISAWASTLTSVVKRVGL